MDYGLSFFNTKSEWFIPTGNLRVAPYEIEQLLSVAVKQKINEHSTLYIKGLLAQGESESLQDISAEGTNVILSALDSAGSEHIIFQGVVKDVSVSVAQETRFIEVYAISYSYLMDIEKKSRTFQKKKIS